MRDEYLARIYHNHRPSQLSEFAVAMAQEYNQRLAAVAAETNGLTALDFESSPLLNNKNVIKRDLDNRSVSPDNVRNNIDSTSVSLKNDENEEEKCNEDLNKTSETESSFHENVTQENGHRSPSEDKLYTDEKRPHDDHIKPQLMKLSPSQSDQVRHMERVDSTSVMEIAPDDGPRPDPNGDAECHVCGVRFRDNLVLKEHFEKVHPKEMFHCTIRGCDKIFSTRKSRNRHSQNENLHRHIPPPPSTLI